jgi:hypothetical protein
MTEAETKALLAHHAEIVVDTVRSPLFGTKAVALKAQECADRISQLAKELYALGVAADEAQRNDDRTNG